MPQEPSPHLPTKIASLALPTREAHVVASVWPHADGTLFFLAEVNLAQPARQQLTQSLTQGIEQAWQSCNRSAGAEDVLEELLQHLNPVLKGYERLLGNPLAPRFHLCLALVQSQTLALSHLGHLAALVLNGQQVTSIFGQGKPRPSHAVFEHLIGGNLEPGETLLLATTSLLDYLSVEKLTRVFALHSPGVALRDIEHGLTTLEHHPPLGAIALQLGELAEQAVGTATSLKQLLATQDHTSSLLKPSLWPTLWSWLRAHVPFSRSGQVHRAPQPAPSDLTTPEPRLRQPRRTWWRHVTAVPAKLAWLKNRESTEATITWWLESKLNTWRALPTAKRVFLVLAVLVLVAFSQSVVSMGKAKLLGLDSEHYNQQVTTITENQAAIEGALIYRDDAKAQEILATTKTLLQSLPRNTRSREQQYQALSSSLALVERRLNRTSELELKDAWTQLPALPEGNTWTTTTLVATTLVSTGSGGQVALVGADGKVQGTLTLPTGFGTPTKALALDTTLLASGSSGKQALIDVKTKSVELVTTPLQLTDGAFYQGRFYYLGGNPQTIFSTTRTGASFSSGVRWLRSGQADPTSARSLTVDGVIFLTDGSNIQKYVRGLKRDFTLQPTTPPLQNIDTIRTTSDTDYLYLISHSDKRIVVYDKQGKLVLQLTFPKVPQLTDVAFDGPNKYIYILNGESLYQVRLSDVKT